MIESSLKKLLGARKELDRLKDEVENTFNKEAAPHCRYYVAPEKPIDDDFDDLIGCMHPTGTVCCIDECPLDKGE